MSHTLPKGELNTFGHYMSSLHIKNEQFSSFFILQLNGYTLVRGCKSKANFI